LRALALSLMFGQPTKPDRANAAASADRNRPRTSPTFEYRKALQYRFGFNLFFSPRFHEQYRRTDRYSYCFTHRYVIKSNKQPLGFSYVNTAKIVCCAYCAPVRCAFPFIFQQFHTVGCKTLDTTSQSFCAILQ
jgi:hypothetical protein